MVDWAQVLHAHGCQLQPGATDDEVTRAETALETVLCDDLRGLYLATDGVYDSQGEWFVIWPLSQVVSRNRNDWAIEVYQTRQELLGFGDDGTGAPFCVRRDGRSGIYIWIPVGGEEVTWLADDVNSFWRGWLAGKLPPY